MNIHKDIKVAKEMGISVQYAVNCRRRYLTNELDQLDLEVAFYRGYEGNIDNKYLALCYQSDAELRRAQAMAELRALKRITQPRKTDIITDDDIDRARQRPITDLIEFKRGKATAFCHEDNNPSLFHATRLNLAICPVCDKRFNSIDVLMNRDAMTFKNAVSYLAGI